uniref:Uncharacterized protein n=1 Tax=Anopheles quadriannulatus TaxID=34691 RepID=A0A182XRN1_ANOQN
MLPFSPTVVTLGVGTNHHTLVGWHCCRWHNRWHTGAVYSSIASIIDFLTTHHKQIVLIEIVIDRYFTILRPIRYGLFGRWRMHSVPPFNRLLLRFLPTHLLDTTETDGHV